MAANPSYDSLPRFQMPEDGADASLPRFAVDESARSFDFEDLDAMKTRVRETSDYAAAPATKVHSRRRLRTGLRARPQLQLDDVIEDLREAAGGPTARELSSRDIADGTCELDAEDLDEVLLLADGEAELVDAGASARPVWHVREAMPVRLPPRPSVVAPPGRAATVLAIVAGVLLAVSAATAALYFTGVTL